MKRWLWASVAIFFFALGVVGMVLPGLPTVIFWIVAAWAASHGWPQLEKRVLEHPHYGSYVLAWREHRSVPRRAKWLATLTMAISIVAFFHLPWATSLQLGLTTLLIVVAIWLWLRPEPDSDKNNEDTTMSQFYTLSARSLRGADIEMKNYQGKVTLVVNTASKCGFTPQYEGLEKLHEQYGDKGLAILGFPCNQFGKQEPGGSDDISEFCQLNYGVSFPMFEKVDVNGDQTHPVFEFLKQELPGTLGKGIKWNFTKFLLDRNGKPVKRYASTTKPEKIEADIVKLLEA